MKLQKPEDICLCIFQISSTKIKKRGEFILHLDVLSYAEIPQKPKICMAAFWKS